MRRPLALAATLALPLTLGFASPAAAFVDLDCSDFTWQEDAQEVYDQFAPDDPHRLDANNDGIACEILPRRGTPPPPPVTPPAPPPPPSQPASGLPYSHNVTVDHIPDVIAARPDGALILYPGNGRGGFLSSYPQIGAGWQTRDMIVHAQDWDRSGARDVIARDPSTGALWLYRGNGSGGFSGQNVIGSGWNGFTAIIAPGDFSGDGNPDLITVRSDGTMNLYPGNGAGGFGSAYPQIGAGWQGRDAITSVGDWDGDGHNDIVAREPANGNLWLYSGNGSGGFVSQEVIGSGWGAFTALVGPGDFDGDGANDILARQANGDLYRYPGNGVGGFGTSYPQIGSGWSPLRIASAGVPSGAPGARP